MFDCYPPFLGFPFSTKFTSRQAHLTLGLVEKHSDGQFVLKALKQKLYVDGLCYLLQVLLFHIMQRRQDISAPFRHDSPTFRRFMASRTKWLTEVTAAILTLLPTTRWRTPGPSAWSA